MISYTHSRLLLDANLQKNYKIWGASVCWGPKCSRLLHDAVLQKNTIFWGASVC